eukprot:609182-Pleurochrysis_carterae.AAC.1
MPAIWVPYFRRNAANAATPQNVGRRKLSRLAAFDRPHQTPQGRKSSGGRVKSGVLLRFGGFVHIDRSAVLV